MLNIRSEYSCEKHFSLYKSALLRENGTKNKINSEYNEYKEKCQKIFAERCLGLQLLGY